VKRFRIKPIVLVSTIIIVGGIGGMPLGFPLSVSLGLITLGIIGNLWSAFQSEKTTENLIELIDAQATLLSHKKLGNTYVEKLKNELVTKGRTTNFHSLMNKALKNDPDNPDVILFYSRWLALWLSHCQRFKYLSEAYIINEAKRLIAMSEKSLKHNPTNYWQRDVLGIVYDILGLHTQAREQFYESGKHRDDLYWLWLVATSWLMEGKNDKALECLEDAISKGVKVLPYDYGCTLQANGRYQEALIYLRKALKKGSNRTEVVDELFRNMRMQCKFISASKYAFILFVIKMKHSIKQSFLSLVSAVFYLLLGLITGILRFAASCLNILILPKIITRKINFIYEPYITISKMLLELEHYRQAEIILTKVSRFNNARILNNLAISQSRQGKHDEAIATTDRALRIYKNEIIFKHNREAFAYNRDNNEFGRLIGLDRKGQLYFPKNKD
jgi:tetratricopeptide (TPR) repeat protein